MTWSASAKFEVRGDTDWFRAHFEAGHVYQISASDFAILTLRLPNGTVLQPPFQYSNLITFLAPTTGDYWVSATDRGSNINFYQITATELAATSPPSVNTTLTLGVGQTINIDTTNQANVDRWYAAQLTAGQSYFFESTGGLSNLYLNDASGNLIGLSRSQYHFTPTTSGTYYLGLNAFTSGTYALHLQTIADDFGETAAAAGTLSIASPATGTWESADDNDWFSISLDAGSSYRFSIGSSSQTQTGSIDVFDSSGHLVSSIVGGYDPESLVFSPTQDGTYYVSANNGLNSTSPIASIAYTLTAVALPGDLTDNQTTSGALTLGSPTTGTFDGLGDVDWYAVSLTAGQSYDFRLNGDRQGAQLRLYDGFGHEVVRSLNGGSDSFSLISQTIASSGTYYVSAAFNNANSPGSYTLTATNYEDDFANNSSTTGTIVAGGIATGRFETGADADWFAVQLDAGLSYAIATSSGVVAIRDAEGHALTRLFDDVHFSPSTTGTYYLEAQANGYPGSDPDDVYAVSIVRVNDDFREDTQSLGVLREQFNGTAGNDTFVSTSNYEAFILGSGDDRFVAGDGYDLYSGGAGIDTVSFSQFGAGVNVSLRLGALFENSLPRIQISAIENVEGTAFADTIEGSAQNNKLSGFAGNDVINAGGGNDVLSGGIGIDLLTGGPGNDVFLDSIANLNGDTITDFSRGDRIVLTDASLAGFNLRSGDGVITFTGGSINIANFHSASISASLAPEGGVQILFSSPPIVISGGGPVSIGTTAGQSAEPLSTKGQSGSVFVPSLDTWTPSHGHVGAGSATGLLSAPPSAELFGLGLG